MKKTWLIYPDMKSSPICTVEILVKEWLLNSYIENAQTEVATKNQYSFTNTESWGPSFFIVVLWTMRK